ncbi:arrestin domain-containing protein 17-like [Schistocerca serialis cubense]|uniref:arrestin domain-containing protein 17-like n=1 Tax=Schistocerca serialis cubense TaxID=2023355 RepID=UPI00214E5CFB|nr:arrestin domain-containing protein 17-like [Schistocerca serialis cubense]
MNYKESSLRGTPSPEQIRRFDVTLDDPGCVYFSGDVVSGKVRVDLDNCLTVQGITVRIVGEAAVSVTSEPPAPRPRLRKNKIHLVVRVWRPSSSPGVADVTSELCPGCRADDWFRSSEKYFEHKFYVFGHKYSSRRERLWAGSHQFPFRVALPTKLPASFHGRFGFVRYLCEATLERAGAPGLTHRAPFSVSCIADLNAEPKAESGAYEQRSTNSCLFCCKKGTVIASAKVKRTGFVPGEEIAVSADILNMSDRPIYRTSARLKQVVTYLSSRGLRSHVDERVVAEVSRGAVASGDSDAWHEVPLTVPPVPPSSRFTNCCKLMDIDYRLDLLVELETEPMELRLPLWLGTVPLCKQFPNLLAAADVDPGLSRVRFPAATMAKYPDLPVSTGEPCVFGPRPLDGYFWRRRPLERAPGVRTSDRGWAPRYPTYRPRPPPEGTVRALLRQSGAHQLPTIVITRPPGLCARHHHAAAAAAAVAAADATEVGAAEGNGASRRGRASARRHSAPDHLMVEPAQ